MEAIKNNDRFNEKKKNEGGCCYFVISPMIRALRSLSLTTAGMAAALTPFRRLSRCGGGVLAGRRAEKGREG